MKKEKKILIIGLIIAIGVLVVVGLLNRYTDSDKFTDDYGVTVPKGVSIVYLTDENVISELSSKDKLVFLAAPGNNDTTDAIKVLFKTTRENGVDKIYYYDLSELDIKDDIVNSLKKKMDVESITNPTLFLVKDKKVASVVTGYNKNTEEKYSDIILDYIMCTKPDC